MNILQDGTGWILPARCAARWTGGLLWKYGLVKFAGHGIDPQADVKKVVMNVRSPTTRFASWYRLLLTQKRIDVSFERYIENLVTEKNPIHFAADLDGEVSKNAFIYPIPLYRYVDILGRQPDHIVRVELMELTLEKAGYPVQTHEWKQPKESELDFTYQELKEHEDYMSIIRSIYQKDYNLFGYPSGTENI